MIIRESWYVAAWARELGEQPLARTICDQKLVLFRTTVGVAALHDRCPHRFAPLSMGEVVEGSLRCPYHGLGFSETGTCVASPYGAPPPYVQVGAVPAVERDGMIWVWMGAVSEADLPSPPDYSFFLQHSQLDYIRMHEIFEGHLMLGVENLLDLSHTNVLHAKSFTIGPHNDFLHAHQDVRMEGERLTVGYSFRNEAGQEINRGEVTWSPPGLMTISFHLDDSGRLLDPVWTQLHIFTPETAHRTHYFSSERFDPSFESADHAAMRTQLFLDIFMQEDNPIIRAIDHEMGEQDFWKMSPALLPTDKAPVLARREYERLLRAEAVAAATPAATAA